MVRFALGLLAISLSIPWIAGCGSGGESPEEAPTACAGQATLPDLTVSEIRVDPDGDGGAKVSVTVQNIGCGDVLYDEIELRTRYGAEGRISAFSSGAGPGAPKGLRIGPGQSFMEVSVETGPVDKIVAEVDPRSRIAELAEDNNVRTFAQP